jgi:hypothetical protein
MAGKAARVVAAKFDAKKLKTKMDEKVNANAKVVAVKLTKK